MLLRQHRSIILLFSIGCFLLVLYPSPLLSRDRFYNYYDEGLKFIEKGDWLRAITAFQSAISLEFEDTNKKRTYGTRFIKYFPHRELGIAYYNLGEHDNARRELELSIAYKKSKSAEQYLAKLEGGEPPPTQVDLAALEALKELEAEEKRIAEEEKRIARARKEEEERLKAEEERLRKERERIAKAMKKEEKERLIAEAKRAKERERLALEEASRREDELERQKALLEEERRRAEEKKKKIILAGALAYDPSKVTQVGSRLSIAVLPFEIKGMAVHVGETVTEKLITQLVNLRRFKVIERQAMDDIMKEQALTMTGMVDEKAAVRVGRIMGADVIILGSANVLPGFGKVNARLIDTETSETIVAKEAQTQDPNIENIEKLVEDLSIMIYNDLPIVEGYIVNVEPDIIYLDIGSEVGVRKGTKCVAFSEGAEIVHPITGEVLGKKVTKLGELVVVQVQEKLAMAKFAEDEKGTVKLGDKVVVK